MKQQMMDGFLFAQMINEGAKKLQYNASKVDALNVFPVPDGDTGTNMNLSFTSGVNEMNRNRQASIGEVCKSLSKGLLMGARGNSGVILSQLFRGFGKSIEQAEQVNAKQFAQGLQQGVETAYKAVMKPVEGTILTVAKDAAQAAIKASRQTDDLVQVLEKTLQEAKASLARTPELLPILKQVGVVDSGGQGLVYVYEGFLQALKGEIIADNENAPLDFAYNIENKEEHVHNEVQEMMEAGLLSVEDIKYGYCTEFIIYLSETKAPLFQENSFRQAISQYGDSLLVISDEELVKVHIHAEQLHKVLELAQSYGQLTKIKIENMREQFLKVQQATKLTDVSTGVSQEAETVQKQKEYGLITVSMGEGLAEIFSSIGVDVVISGGQTMNPSTEDFVKAIEQVKADHVFILPNNSNVILAAEQSAQLVETSVTVIPTKNIPQGLATLLSFNASAGVEENKQQMFAAKERVKAGQVTYAVRDTTLDGLEIKKDQYMGIEDGKIAVTASDQQTCTMQLVDKMVNEESEIVTIIYGTDVSAETAQQLVDELAGKYPDIEVELYDGGQPVYAYLISVE